MMTPKRILHLIAHSFSAPRFQNSKSATTGRTTEPLENMRSSSDGTETEQAKTLLKEGQPRAPGLERILTRVTALLGVGGDTGPPQQGLRTLKSLPENVAVLRAATIVMFSPYRRRILATLKQALEPRELHVMSRCAAREARGVGDRLRHDGSVQNWG